MRQPEFVEHDQLMPGWRPNLSVLWFTISKRQYSPMLISSVLDAIGKTPLVELSQWVKKDQIHVFAKLESMNPGGSIKDRIGVAMVLEAEKTQVLAPGDTIIEATAGNTGVALAMVAAVRGYGCVFVMPEKMSRAKSALLEAYGARVIRTPNAPPSSPDNFRQVAKRLAQENGWFLPEQFSHPANPNIHYTTTGPEIWEDMQHEIDAFVIGVGTGGTLTGAGRFLKEKWPEVRIILADPEGSTLGGGPDAPYSIEGIGGSDCPVNFDASLVDEAVYVSDEEAFDCCAELASRYGILVGGAAGCCAAAARKWAHRQGSQNLRIATIFQDTGRNYLSLESTNPEQD